MRCRDCGTRYRSGEVITHVYVTTQDGERALPPREYERFREQLPSLASA